MIPSISTACMRVTGAVWLVLLSDVVAAQSLGEIARREEARRKSVKAPSPVYTNRDLRGRSSVPPPELSPSGASGGGSTASPSPDNVEPGSDSDQNPAEQKPVKDEAYWRARITAARTDVDRSKTYIDALQSRINALTTDFVNRDDPAQRALIEADRNKALAELDRLIGQLQQQLKTVADIEEEARHAGVPPGWLR